MKDLSKILTESMKFNIIVNMEITEVLGKAGLEEKEAKVYLALLELGTADVSDIANKAGIKRPTCYLVLEDLKNKGLVSQVPAKINLFTAESPEKLASEMYKKQELYKRFLPNMMALYNTKKDKPQVLLFEGREGLAQVYNKIFSSPTVDFFSTIRDVFKMFPEMPKFLKKKVLDKEIKVREILTQTEADLEYVSWIKQHEYYQSKFAPKNFDEFLTDSAIFGDNVAFFSFKPAVFVVQIHSKEVSQSLKILFDLAWLAGEPYEKVIKEKTALA